MSQNSKEKMEKKQIKLKEARYKFTGRNEVIKKKIEAVQLLVDSFFSPDYVCKQLGMHRRSFYRWKEKDPEFERACDEIKEGLKDEAEVLLQHRMRKEDTTAIIFYLKTQGKERGYVEKREIEHFGIVQSMTKEEREAEIKRLTGK